MSFELCREWGQAFLIVVIHKDEECRHFEDILAEGPAQYSLTLHAYCWMKNHVHMALQVKGKPLSKRRYALALQRTG